MRCQFCESPATVQVTNIVNKKKRVIRLCERCAVKHNLIPDPAAPQIGLKALMHLLAGSLQHAPTAGPVALTCPACGLQYAEFRAEGRLGCPADYDAFRPALEPLLERIHRATTHAGKAPRAVRRQRAAAELAELRKQLQAAVKSEQYEEAARLRDLIRQKEALG